jgi:tRNA(Ile)-lysidine synthetase-like protein
VIRRLVPDAGFLEVERLRRTDSPASPAPATAAPAPRLAVETCNCDRTTFKAHDPVGHLDADLVRQPLAVGSRKPGDRMRPLGLAQPKRLQDILVDAHVPRHLRDTLPLVSDVEEIVWIPGVTIADSKRVTAATRRQLHLEIVRG